MKYCAIAQCRSNNSRYIESLFTLSLANGSTEISQSPDSGITDHQYNRRLLIYIGYTHH